MSIKTLGKSLASKQGWLTRTIREGNKLIGSDQLTLGKLKRIVKSPREKWSSYQATFNQLKDILLTEEDSEVYDQIGTPKNKLC